MDDFQFQTLQRGIDGIHARLDRLNGRVGESEMEIAVLKDRSDRAERQGGLYGAMAGGLISGIILTIQKFMGK